MTRRFNFLLGILFICSATAFAQSGDDLQQGTFKTFMEDAKYPDRPKDMSEFGIHVGSAILGGDIKSKLGYGAGIHFRKSWNYALSFRFSYSFLNMYNEDDKKQGIYDTVLPGNTVTNTSDWRWKTNTTMHYLSGELVVSLNNINFHKARSDWNYYLYAGAGGYMYNPRVADYNNANDTHESGYSNVGVTNRPVGTFGSYTDYKPGVFTAIHFGGGISRRLSEKASISLDQKVIYGFLDRLDGKMFSNIPSVGRRGVTGNPDIPMYTSIRLNFNLGDAAEKAEPLWWLNPLDAPLTKLDDLEKKIDIDWHADADGDGVPDGLDKEANSPAGAIVDTRGVTMDSDKDGVPDYKDSQPFTDPGKVGSVNGSGVAPDEPKFTDEDVKRVGKAEGWYEKPAPVVTNNGGAYGSGSTSSWFLPMIHFDTDKSKIKSQYYSQLHHVATVMKKNPGIRVVVEGHADSRGGVSYNNRLAYRRAKAAIDYLTTNYGINRSNLILRYNGETTPMVTSAPTNYMNRRVEFKVANGESEMSSPN